MKADFYLFFFLYQPTIAQWRIVFLIASVVYSICATFYVIFGEGDRQKWDDPSKDYADDNTTKQNELNETRQMLNKSEKTANQ